MLHISTLFVTLLLIHTSLYAQEKLVAITMDDLFAAFKNMKLDELEEANESLLHAITTFRVPVTIFVNEGSFNRFGDTERTHSIYRKWIANPLVTIGNHTYSHKNYASTPFTQFTEDILKGEVLMKDLLNKQGKTLQYFRFPYNCTGNDNHSKSAISAFLQRHGYTITPFTIESMDYVYNTLYTNHLKHGQDQQARDILDAYLTFTVDLFQYFETFIQESYGRPIRHIFLCHTNQLHVDGFEELIHRLERQGYQFISLDDALADEIYQRTDYYTEHFGISWVYRWIEDPEERMARMRQEPFPAEIAKQYKALQH